MYSRRNRLGLAGAATLTVLGIATVPVLAQDVATGSVATGIVQSDAAARQQNQTPDAKSAAQQAREQAENEVRVGVTPGKSTPLALRDAILMALQKNPDIELQRIAVRQAGFDVTRSRGAYDLNINEQFTYNAVRNPAVSPFAGADASGGVETRTAQSALNLTQPFANGSRLSFDFATSRQDTSNTFAGLNPSYTSSFAFTFTQPLFRNNRIDDARRQVLLNKKRLSLTDSQFRQRVIDIIAQVQAAYWDLVFARRDVEIKEEAVSLAETQLAQNRRFVEAGTLAPVEIVSVEAQLEQRKEELLTSLEGLTRAENALKTLILENRSATLWDEALSPTDQVNLEPVNIALGDAVQTALKNRPEMEQFAIQKESNNVDVKYFRNQLLPQLDFIGSYGLQGLSGTSVAPANNPFSGGFNTAILSRVNQLSANAGLGPVVIPPQTNPVAPIFLGGYGTNIANLFKENFYTVKVGVQFSFSLQNRVAKSNLGRAIAQDRVIDTQRTKTETQIESEVRNALQSVQTTLKRVQASRASRIAAEAQYESEVRRYQVGESTNFLVLDRQNALSGARGREIRALTDYNKAVVALQRAMSTTLEVNSLKVKPAPESGGDAPEVEPKP